MKTFWQVEFTDFRGVKTRYKFKFTTRPDAERFIATQRKPNMRAIEVTPFEEPIPQVEPIDRDPGDEAASVEGDDAAELLRLKGPRSEVTRAELTRARKIAALAKARAAKAAKRASMVRVEHSGAV